MKFDTIVTLGAVGAIGVGVMTLLNKDIRELVLGKGEAVYKEGTEPYTGQAPTSGETWSPGDTIWVDIQSGTITQGPQPGQALPTLETTFQWTPGIIGALLGQQPYEGSTISVLPGGAITTPEGTRYEWTPAGLTTSPAAPATTTTQPDIFQAITTVGTGLLSAVFAPGLYAINALGGFL